MTLLLLIALTLSAVSFAVVFLSAPTMRGQLLLGGAKGAVLAVGLWRVL